MKCFDIPYETVINAYIGSGGVSIQLSNDAAFPVW
jgi:hypothetical protein